MSAEKHSIAERQAQRQAALAQRRAEFVETWLEIRGDDPFLEFTFRRMFAVELLVHQENLKTNAASFLGQACVDRNAFSPRQKAWMTVLVDEFLGTTPQKPETKSKKKTEAGK